MSLSPLYNYCSWNLARRAALTRTSGEQKECSPQFIRATAIMNRPLCGLNVSFSRCTPPLSPRATKRKKRVVSYELRKYLNSESVSRNAELQPLVAMVPSCCVSMYLCPTTGAYFHVKFPRNTEVRSISLLEPFPGTEINEQSNLNNYPYRIVSNCTVT